MTRRGLFKTLFGGIFAALGWNRIKARPKCQFIAEFKASTLPAHQEWQVAILHVINKELSK